MAALDKRGEDEVLADEAGRWRNAGEREQKTFGNGKAQRGKDSEGAETHQGVDQEIDVDAAVTERAGCD